DALTERLDLDEARGVDAQPHEDVAERVVIEPAPDHIRVERVDQRVRFPVVAVEELDGARRRVEARPQQLGELEADLLAQIPEPAADQMLNLVLEDDAVRLDAVERELGAN